MSSSFIFLKIQFSLFPLACFAIFKLTIFFRATNICGNLVTLNLLIE